MAAPPDQPAVPAGRQPSRSVAISVGADDSRSAKVKDADAPKRPLRRYRAHGLNWSSEIDLRWPAAAPVDGPPDVEVRLGAVPCGLDSPAAAEGCWQASPDAFLVRMDGIGRCLVSDGGRRVRVALAEGGGDAIACLLDSVVAACLQMRGFLVLQASAVATAAGAVLFTGGVGRGKSTLAAGLVDRGYALLADGIVGVVPDGALAGPPSVRLWFNVMGVLDGAWRLAAGAPVRRGIPCYAVPAPRAHGGPLPVRAVYQMVRSIEASPAVEPLTPPQAFAAVAAATMRPRFLRGLGQERAHFRAVATVVRGAAVGCLETPAAPRNRAALAAWMAERLPPPCP